jgi:hypothetical protein
MRQSVQRKFLLDDVGALGCIQRMREGLHRRSRPVHLPLHQIVHCHCHHRHFLCAVCTWNVIAGEAAPRTVSRCCSDWAALERA